MRRHIFHLLLIAALAACGVVSADVVNLRSGGSVSGKIIRIEKDKLVLRTDSETKTFSREQVKTFTFTRPGPDGTPRTVTAMFKPKPITMPFEVETAHYQVKTDISERVGKNAGRAMEQLYKAYSKIFNAEDIPQGRKAEVLIFDTKGAFLKYAQSINTQPRADTLGFFRSASDGSSSIVTFRRQTDEFNTLSTLYHEGTHQFITLVLGRANRPPLWVNEGLAVYFENSTWRKGKLRTGIIPRKRLLHLQHSLRQGKMVHLADLIQRGRPTFDGLCYAESWSLVYFFVHANRGAYAGRFKKYFRALKTGTGHDEAFRACLTKDINKLERLWKKYVMGLKAPPK